MTYFLDTSAVVKLYQLEPGYERMGAIYDASDAICLASLTRLEFLSAITRRFREGSISEHTYPALLEQFTNDIHNRYEVFSFTNQVVEDAIQFLLGAGSRLPLRSLDALQFAFYRVHCAPNGIFVSSDQRL